jgi:uncharacterized coiled-coil protein SlyX
VEDRVSSLQEQLLNDTARLRRAINALVISQERVVERLRTTLDEQQAELDKHVLRLALLRDRFGEANMETIAAMRDAEDASKPVTETRTALERQRQIREVFRSKHNEVQALPGAESERLTLADFTT